MAHVNDIDTKDAAQTVLDVACMQLINNCNVQNRNVHIKVPYVLKAILDDMYVNHPEEFSVLLGKALIRELYERLNLTDKTILNKI